jgi:hypothetical protein
VLDYGQCTHVKEPEQIHIMGDLSEGKDLDETASWLYGGANPP